MSFTSHQFDRLLLERAQEGQYLEFKRGVALANSPDGRRELVKDCSGFANAGGGTIVYGVAEEEIDGVSCATSLQPVQAEGIDGDWITNVLRSNTSPPLNLFEITELPVVNGRVVVIEIEASTTAHQSLLDHRYYQRAGRSTAPMVDFQIRDVMNRRMRPLLQVTPKLANISTTGDLHRKMLEISIKNIGQVTIEKWRLEFDVPLLVIRDSRDEDRTEPLAKVLASTWHDTVQIVVDETDRHIFRISHTDPDDDDGRRRFLHPGQEIKLLGVDKMPEVIVEVGHKIWRSIHGQPMTWRMYLPNSQPLQGEWPFDSWCNF